MNNTFKNYFPWHEIPNWLREFKKPVPKCPTCGGPLETVKHSEERETAESQRARSKYAGVHPFPKTKDDPPPPEPEYETIILKSAQCAVCGWESARQGPCSCEMCGGRE
jgi:hypothetical protein